VTFDKKVIKLKPASPPRKQYWIELFFTNTPKCVVAKYSIIYRNIHFITLSKHCVRIGGVELPMIEDEKTGLLKICVFWGAICGC